MRLNAIVEIPRRSDQFSGLISDTRHCQVRYKGIPGVATVTVRGNKNRLAALTLTPLPTGLLPDTFVLGLRISGFRTFEETMQEIKRYSPRGCWSVEGERSKALLRRFFVLAAFPFQLNR